MTASTMDTAPIAKALLAAPKTPAPPQSQTMVEVARQFGVSPFRQMREMWTLRRSATKIANHEYYAARLFDPQMSMAEKKTYVGRTGSYLINSRLSPLPLTEMRPFLRDKVAYTALLQQLGLPTTETQALVSTSRRLGSLAVLRDAAAIEAFLTRDARFPLFGKPAQGEASVGSALITGVDADARTVSLGNGTQASLDQYIHEVLADYPEGYIFQTALAQHPDMTAMIGQAVGTMRVVTVCDEDGPRVLYTVWKVPSPSAMSDNFWQDGSMVAEIDDATGRVVRCNIGTGLRARWLDRHPVSDVAFEGFQIPHWDAIRQTATDAHALFPEFGIVGWDIGVTADGPAIIECNDNSFHVLYQLAAGRGIHNADFVPVFDKVARYVQALHDSKVALFKRRTAAIGR